MDQFSSSNNSLPKQPQVSPSAGNSGAAPAKPVDLLVSREQAQQQAQSSSSSASKKRKNMEIQPVENEEVREQEQEALTTAKKRLLNPCAACRTAHAKCTNQKPCERCVKLGIVCEEAPSTKRGRKRSQAAKPAAAAAEGGDAAPAAEAVSEPSAPTAPVVTDNSSDSILKQLPCMQYPSMRHACLAEHKQHFDLLRQQSAQSTEGNKFASFDQQSISEQLFKEIDEEKQAKSAATQRK